MKNYIYLNRKAVTHCQSQSYKLEFIETDAVTIGRCDRPREIKGRILYTAPDGRIVGTMCFGDPRDIRISWHRLCRVNRARVAGRNYLHLINHMDNRERRVLGHAPKSEE